MSTASVKTRLTLGPAWASLVLAAVPVSAQAQASISSITQPSDTADAASDQKANRAAKRAARKAVASKQSISGTNTVAGGDIIVTGIRKSVAASVNRKRNARQIVDVVTSEDAASYPTITWSRRWHELRG